MCRGWQFSGMIISVGLGAAPAFAASGFDTELAKRTQTINVSYDYGIPVDKSNTVDGTDFGSAQRYALGIYTGSTRALGLGLRYDHSKTDFTQANGSMDAEWTDFNVSYRIMMLYPTFVMGSTSFLTEQADTELVHALGISRGGGLGVRVPAGGIATVQFELLYVVVPKAIDAGGHDIKIGPRFDADLGVALRAFSDHATVLTGYRYRSYKLSVDGDAKAELETGPYLGVSVGLSP